MDLLTQFVVGVVSSALPQGTTLAHVSPAEGRVDALLSHGVSVVVDRIGNPIVSGLYAAARPMIDGALVGAVGPVAIHGKPKQVRASRPSRTVVRRKKKQEFSSRGVEILNAEFVDVPEVRK